MQPLNTKLLIGIACAMGIMLACSQSKASAHTAADTGNAVAANDADGPADTLDCAKVFAPGNVSGILSEPAKVSTYTYRSGSCDFGTENSGKVRIYSGTDITNELTWKDVTNSSHRTNYVAMGGVGDEAYRNVKDGTELFARKGKLYCTVLLLNVTNPVTAHGEALTKKMGALCDKVFAAK